MKGFDRIDIYVITLQRSNGQSFSIEIEAKSVVDAHFKAAEENKGCKVLRCAKASR